MAKRHKFDGVFLVEGKLATKAFGKRRVYGEKIISGYRIWDPTRSQLAAYILKDPEFLPLKQGDAVLYLGASTGTTPSHVSDMVGGDGLVFCVEFAQRMMRELMNVCADRENMIPLFADANKPSEYEEYLQEKADLVYQDVAQKEQAKIFVKNVRCFLKKQGYGLLMVKARSVDVTKKPSEIYSQVEKELKEAGLKILDKRKLDPYEKDHMAFLIRF